MSITRIQALGLWSLFLMSASVAIAAPQQAPTVEMQRVVEFDRGADRPILSPDGRWIAFALEEDRERFAIWIVPSSGGEPSRLTDGRHTDLYPRWFPNSTRIAFASDRNEGRSFDFYPWAVSFDPATGAPLTLRQLSIDRIAPPASGFQVSPDGERLAYVHSLPGVALSEIRVAPISGGRPTILAKHDVYLGQLRWTPNGDSIVYMQRTVDLQRTISRIAVDGGTVEELWSGGNAIRIASDGRSFLSSQGANADQSRDWIHHSIDGRELGRMRVPAGLEVDFFYASGQLTASERNIVSPIWIKRLGGGASRELTTDSKYYWIYDWATEESGILAHTDTLLLQIPTGGGEPRIVHNGFNGTGGKFATNSSSRGDVLFVDWYDDDIEYFRLVRHEPGSETSVVLTESFPPGHSLRGRGGARLRDGRRDIFLESVASGDSIRVVATNDATREIMLELPSDRALGLFAVADTVVAYAWGEQPEFGITIVPNRHTENAVRASLASLGAEAEAAPMDLVWSHSGDHLAIVTSSDEGTAVTFVAWTGSGLVPVASQRLDAKYFWDTQWLPDGRGVVAAAMGLGESFDTALLFVPLDPTRSSSRIAEGDVGSIFSFAVSPDGHEVAYMTQMHRGTTIWLLELP